MNDATVDFQALYIEAIQRFGDLGMGVMRLMAEGATRASILDFVGLSLDAVDYVDEESMALFERAQDRIAADAEKRDQ